MLQYVTSEDVKLGCGKLWWGIFQFLFIILIIASWILKLFFFFLHIQMPCRGHFWDSTCRVLPHVRVLKCSNLLFMFKHQPAVIFSSQTQQQQHVLLSPSFFFFFFECHSNMLTYCSLTSAKQRSSHLKKKTALKKFTQ